MHQQQTTRMFFTAMVLVGGFCVSAGAGVCRRSSLPVQVKNLTDPAQHRKWKLVHSERCGLSHSERIIGGTDAALGSYPWLARIGYIFSDGGSDEVLFRCGAVLISRYYVVTAAHCVTSLPSGLKVGRIRLGEHNTETDPDCEEDVCADPVQDFFPKTIVYHEEYGKPEFRNDISVIRLDRPATFTSYVLPICLLHGDLMTKDYTGEMTEVAGWGITDIDHPSSSKQLQTIKLPVVSNELCKVAFRAHADIGPTQMCVGGIVGMDSCGGDSGGPLMKVEAYNGPPRYYLLGVVSFGAKQCGATDMPGVYTRITAFMTWILDNVHL